MTNIIVLNTIGVSRFKRIQIINVGNGHGIIEYLIVVNIESNWVYITRDV